VVVTALTACGARPTDSAATSSQQAPTLPAATSTNTAPTTQLPVDDADPTAGDGAPTAPDAASAAAALTRATAAMRAFARTDLAQADWWAGVSGYFTPAAGTAYKSTDVANVPVHAVTEGSAKLLPGSTGYRAEVTVDTDAGTYTVTLIRADADWLVDRAEPPKS